MNEDSRDIVLKDALVHRISTTADGGWSVTFLLTNQAGEEVMKLSKLRDQCVEIRVN